MKRWALLPGLAWLVVSASSSHAATITRGPYLQSATPTSVVIRWRTATPTDTRVHVGPVPEELLEVAYDPVPATEHEVVVTDLVPATRYAYQVGSSLEVLAGGDSCAFTTLPLPGADVAGRFWIVGDSGTGGALARSVRDGYLAFEARGGRPADVWLMLGDNAYQTGTDAEYQTALFDVFPRQLRNWCLYPTRGNHDAIHVGGANDYYDLFTLPVGGEAGGLASGTEAWYSFDYGRVHFVCLDSEGSGRTPSSPMLQWLRADLAATTADWIVAFWHHPPYTRGSHDSDNVIDSGGRMRDMRLNVVPILDSAGVDLTLTGHSHSYERSFLLSGHYGVSSTLTQDMRVDDGDGRPDGDGAYQKTFAGAPLDGVVHVGSPGTELEFAL